MDVVTTAAATQHAFATDSLRPPARQEDEVTTAVAQGTVEGLDDQDRTPSVRPAEERGGTATETRAETESRTESRAETRAEASEPPQPAPAEEPFRGREVDVVA
ncbi:MAG: hypothetical protein H6907_08945 [Hyphomicrobiales bacterium]|nr:hypothetical protein [Hyphomicrobiales bacterium]MCP5371844.1 hypothetical protein [Hyphomicrobiales bacterium]